MFYGIPEAQKDEFERAIGVICAAIPRYFVGDMLISLGRNMGFMEDPAFVAAVNAEQPGTQEASLTWRLHVLCWCARNALRLEGDFVECGVLRGFMTAVAARYLSFETLPRRWHLYDTFQGIPAEQLDAGHENPAGYLDPGLHAFVRQRFAAYPNIEIHRGRVPEVLAGTAPGRIALLHLDMNSAAAEVGALEALYDRLVAGAHVLLDDYGWYVYRSQKVAEDTFFAKRGVGVLELPTGQGLVIKPGPAAA